MNIVLVALEAVRADHLSCYGYDRPTSPYMDTLASRGALLRSHFSPACGMQPAFTTMFSGVHPLTHRIIAHEGRANPNPGITWLSLLMRHRGFTTAAVDNLIDHRPWFARGFEYYMNPRRRGEHADCSAVAGCAIEWIEQLRRQPFFLFVHFQNAHAPWYVDEPLLRLFYQGDPTATNVGSLDRFYAHPQTARWPRNWFDHTRTRLGPTTGRRIEDAAFLTALYDATIREQDNALRQLGQALNRSGLLEDTLLVICSDHGVELAGEHGIWFDQHGLYDGCLRSPLILHWPAAIRGGHQVAALTQHTDLVATMVDAAGGDCPDDMVEGRSLMPLACNQSSISHWNHTLMACECTWQAKWAMRTAEYKLIVAREPDYLGNPPVELYDLLDDPSEQRNIADQSVVLRDKLVETFDQRLKAMLEQRSLKADPIAPGRLTLGRHVFERLGRPYPPRDPGWRPPPPPVITTKAAGRSQPAYYSS